MGIVVGPLPDCGRQDLRMNMGLMRFCCTLKEYRTSSSWRGVVDSGGDGEGVFQLEGS
jgi:hypothetical protein